MTTAELHARIVSDAVDAIIELRRYEDAMSPFEGPTWHDALAVLVETVRDQPSDGFAVLDADQGHQPGIVRAVIRGWSAATIDAEAAEEILDRFTQIDMPVMLDDIARLLSEGGQRDANPTEWHRYPAAQRLATQVWSALDGQEPDPGLDGWLGRAINDPAGWIAEFWTHAVATDWRSAGDSWTGLPAATRAQLDVLLAGDDSRTAMAEVVLASQVFFFFGADRTWCEARVLPLLDWASPTRARSDLGRVLEVGPLERPAARSWADGALPCRGETCRRVPRRAPPTSERAPCRCGRVQPARSAPLDADVHRNRRERRP